MALSLDRYAVMLGMQIGFILVDLLINSFSDCFRHHSVILLIIYLLQDVSIIFALITLVLCYFSTYQFQAGMVESLVERDRTTLLVTMIYLLITIGWQYWSLNVDWDSPMELNWTTAMLIFYDIQRSVCVFYYYLYKRSALMLSDPRLYISFSPFKARVGMMDMSKMSELDATGAGVMHLTRVSLADETPPPSSSRSPTGAAGSCETKF